MNIGIDARFYGPSGKGIGRYTQKLIESLGKLDNQNEYFIFLNQEGFDSYQPANSRFHKILVNIPWYSVKEQLLLPKILKQYQLDLMHFLHFNVPLLYQGRFVVTVHDVTLFDFNNAHGQDVLHQVSYNIKKIFFKMIFDHAIKKSQQIIVDSHYTKECLLGKIKLPGEKIKIINLGL
jgi:glycosyltransferase involved in cell wall biosynthesis